MRAHDITLPAFLQGVRSLRLIPIMLAASTQAMGATPAPADDGTAELRTRLDAAQQELLRLRRSLLDQERRLQADRNALEEQRRILRGLQANLDGEPADLGEPMGNAALQAKAGRGAEGSGPPAGDAPASTPTVGQAPEPAQQTKPPEIAPIFDQPGVLTPKGKYVLEPSLEYAYSSSNRVSVIGFEIFPALLIGVIDIRTANRNSYTWALTGRYGLTNRLEAEIKVPYVYRTEMLQTREFLQASFADSNFHSTGSDLGDVELALRYQFNQGGMEKPYYVGTLRVKTRTGKDQFEVPLDPDVPRNIGGRFKEQPTGTGFYGIRPEFTVIYPTDPVVFFGSVNYLWNVKRDHVTDRLGRTNDIDPGDAVGFNFGMGLALNERASFSVGYEHTIYGRSKINGLTPETEQITQLGSLLVGYSYKLTSRTYFNLALGIGATRDAPDVQINIRLPTTF